MSELIYDFLMFYLKLVNPVGFGEEIGRFIGGKIEKPIQIGGILCKGKPKLGWTPFVLRSNYHGNVCIP
jgi:hypothetical protein